MNDVVAQVGELAVLHELVVGVNVAHILQEACHHASVYSDTIVRKVRTEWEYCLDVILRHDPGNDVLVERPNLVHRSLSARAEVLCTILGELRVYTITKTLTWQANSVTTMGRPYFWFQC